MSINIEYIEGLPIIEIENFISIDQCDCLLNNRINQFESAISHYPDYYRNNDRLVEDNDDLSQELFGVLNEFNENYFNDFVGLNNRLRFCRYQKDQLFSKHQDGVHYPNDNHESKYTFLLYLNAPESFSSGNTEFFISKYDEKPCKTIIPQKGKLVIFDHKIWHKGAKITLGNKYILRSDIFVNRQMEFKHHKGYIWSLLSSDKNHFFSCGRDTTIKLWDNELRLINSIKIHTKSVLKIARLNSDEFVSCSRDFTLKKWNYSVLF
ncbi:2OG-Fe(II) oxygenase [Lacinutrix neustonica]|uniref:2OG-Fe(II) oxygenase n=1 Tax=Lacinutrix neustonica TaxID=2980107 RepID=A0A9E8MVY8_9FLAO|nr:2OG-Fe(II) oxygenase [Lacinutrix neustonica]WAC02498.1 2OG-Fe(II) oxygenase [Lacinutrix neustonica]